MRRQAPLVLAVLLVLVLPATAIAAPQERDRRFVDRLLARLEPILALVLPQTPGPDADPDGVAEPPPPESEGDAGPDADPDG